MHAVAWGRAFRIRYSWQEMDPDPTLSGEGVIHYDAARQAYALHNRFAASTRRLDCLLDEAAGRAWVSERRDGQRRCSLHRTDRRVEMHRHVAEGTARGQGQVLARAVRIVEWREAGDHDRWLWFVDATGRPVRFLTWTHHGRILILHDVTVFETDVAFADTDFRPPAEWGCPPA